MRKRRSGLPLGSNDDGRCLVEKLNSKSNSYVRLVAAKFVKTVRREVSPRRHPFCGDSKWSVGIVKTVRREVPTAAQQRFDCNFKTVRRGVLRQRSAATR